MCARARATTSGLIEVAVPSSEYDAASKAVDAGLMDAVGNGVFRVRPLMSDTSEAELTDDGHDPHWYGYRD